MKPLSWISMFVTVCLLLLLGCDNQDDSNGTDADSDTNSGTDTDTDADTEECDPGFSWMYDPYGEYQGVGASGFAPLFYPPDPVCLPKDVSLYQHNLMDGFYDWVQEKAVAYLDPTCVADCEDMQDDYQLQRSWQLESDALVLSAQNNEADYQVVINDTVIEITPAWQSDGYAWIDGECVGEIEYGSWEIIGEC